QTSFMDLPENIHLKIFKNLDFESLHKMRVNKKLDKLLCRVKSDIDFVHLTIYSAGERLSAHNRDERNEFTDLNQFEKTMIRFNVKVVDINLNHTPNEQRPWKYVLPHLTFSTLLNASRKIRRISIEYLCNLLTGQELFTLRKMILEGDCKLKHISVAVEEREYKSFMQNCFGVTIEDVKEPNRRTRMYTAEDKSVKLYSDDISIRRVKLNHVESEYLRVQGAISLRCSQVQRPG
ncbi:hypothetical protein PENTCL1PPCAC_22176, partial [Pristionchus entomophagus]